MRLRIFLFCSSFFLLTTLAAQNGFSKWKATPDDFQPVKDTLFLEMGSNNTTLGEVQDFDLENPTADNQKRPFQKVILLNTWGGQPFQKTPDDLVWLNYATTSNQLNPQIVQVPEAIKMYVAKDQWRPFSPELDADVFKSDIPFQAISELSPEARSALSTPFYMRKYEVTNLEYRTFLADVKKQNQTKKEALYTYTFQSKSNAALAQMDQNSLNVYPDTTVWIKDFAYSYNQPMVDHYLSHPAYDNYPVVGINWFQAMAYLDWMTVQHQAFLDAENVPYDIEYTLPDDIEWTLAVWANADEKGIVSYTTSEQNDDNNWLSDLRLSAGSPVFNSLTLLMRENDQVRGTFILDGTFHTAPVDPTFQKQKGKNTPTDAGRITDNAGFCWMGGNVSEWTRNSYAQYQPGFETRLQSLSTGGKKEDLLTKSILEYYDAKNEPKGMLIRGTNWFDERYGTKTTGATNAAGVSAKSFQSPYAQHSTLGFRYVVHIAPKVVSDNP